MLIEEKIGTVAGKFSEEFSQRETGFPSPATDHLETRLNLNDHLVQNKNATFFCRIRGSEEAPLGFQDGDLLVVDRSLAFKHHSFVIVVLGGELRLCRLWNSGERWSLQTSEREFIRLKRDESTEEVFWGVVSYVIHSCI